MIFVSEDSFLKKKKKKKKLGNEVLVSIGHPEERITSFRWSRETTRIGRGDGVESDLGKRGYRGY